MSRVTGFLMNIRRIMKLHDGMLKEICAKYQLTPIEAKIIRFLYNNPEKDTATDSEGYYACDQKQLPRCTDLYR